MSRYVQSSALWSPSLKGGVKVILWLTIIIAVIAVLVEFSNVQASTQSASHSSIGPSQSAAVAKVKRENLAKEIEIAADFIPFQEVELQAKVAGYVKAINVDIGDHVTKGQVLATLEVPELKEDLTKAKAAVKRYRSEIVHRQSEIRRYEALSQQANLTYERLASVNVESPNLVAQQDIDVARASALASAAHVDAEKANLDVAKHQLAEAIANEKRMQDMLDYSHITAPFTGVITKRYVDVGTMVQTATSNNTQRAEPVVDIAQVNSLRLVFPVPESYMSLIKKGTPVTVEVPALAKTFPAEVWRYASKAVSSTRTMETQVLINNPEFEFKPGMVATVSLDLALGKHSLAVPVEAVSISEAASISSDRMGTVWVVTPDNQIEERQVKLGFETPTEYQVISGLSENELVIIAGKSQFRVGQKVEPKLVEFKQISQ